tara:strand:- start:229 stop:465 length:237 start_codon:yes stop_codon:yes gene_type:complete
MSDDEDMDEEEERIDPGILVGDLYAACKASDRAQAKELLELKVPPFYSSHVCPKTSLEHVPACGFSLSLHHGLCNERC